MRVHIFCCTNFLQQYFITQRLHYSFAEMVSLSFTSLLKKKKLKKTKKIEIVTTIALSIPTLRNITKKHQASMRCQRPNISVKVPFLIKGDFSFLWYRKYKHFQNSVRSRFLSSLCRHLTLFLANSCWESNQIPFSFFFYIPTNQPIILQKLAVTRH